MNFSSWVDFQNFVSSLKFKNRFIHSTEVINFLNNIERTLPSRERNLPFGTILYRAQLGINEIESEGGVILKGHPPQRMKPIPRKGKEGRANPKGISYLYLADNEVTALSELRPHLGQYISSAQFKVQRNLRLVDCYSVTKKYSHARCIFDPPKTDEEIICAIWSMINEAFSKPVTNDEESADYIPTQVLAEHFKSNGFDGVYYKSSMGPGNNFLLFNLDDAELVNCTVMETMEVNYMFRECANRYFVNEQNKNQHLV